MVLVCVRWLLHETLWRFIVSVALKSLNRIHEIILCITFCKSKPHTTAKTNWNYIENAWDLYFEQNVRSKKKIQFNFRQAHFLVDRLYYLRSFLFTHETIYWFECVALYCECVFFLSLRFCSFSIARGASLSFVYTLWRFSFFNTTFCNRYNRKRRMTFTDGKRSIQHGEIIVKKYFARCLCQKQCLYREIK